MLLINELGQANIGIRLYLVTDLLLLNKRRGYELVNLNCFVSPLTSEYNCFVIQFYRL